MGLAAANEQSNYPIPAEPGQQSREEHEHRRRGNAWLTDQEDLAEYGADQ
jgi:hypothetical protein